MTSRYSKQFTIPDEFPSLLKEFAREVLRNQPKNIYEFGAHYFDKLLEERRRNQQEGSRPITGPGEGDKERTAFQEGEEEGVKRVERLDVENETGNHSPEFLENEPLEAEGHPTMPSWKEEEEEEEEHLVENTVSYAGGVQAETGGDMAEASSHANEEAGEPHREHEGPVDVDGHQEQGQSTPADDDGPHGQRDMDVQEAAWEEREEDDEEQVGDYRGEQAEEGQGGEGENEGGAQEDGRRYEREVENDEEPSTLAQVETTTMTDHVAEGNNGGVNGDVDVGD